MKDILGKTGLLLVLAAGLLLFISCQKETSMEEGQTINRQQVSVFLNDDPGFDFTKVLVDIRYVEIKIDSSRRNHPNHDRDEDGDDDHHQHDNYGQWDTLAVTPGLYDLMRLRNGVDTLLASGYTWNGRVTKLRFTLGDSSRVFTDSTTSAALTICDNKPYVYVKLRQSSIDTTAAGQIAIRIDFDIAKSIRESNGAYCLRPVLKSYSHKTTGEIEGRVLPRDARTLVRVSNSTDTAYAIPFADGEFKIKGLEEGTYDVLYDAVAPYQDTTINNVRVNRRSETELPTITLHP